MYIIGPFEIDSRGCLKRLEKKEDGEMFANSKGDGRIDEEEWKEHV
ncbi:hypothetical protein TorRG33x02_070580 [Trema orientale]|uniref:Uncharacterized protein n=1 Tax=Trema orientale TaxID=63057 RepID=A0A2P5FHP8_TREOI|nr:hypothetical protein TorRG33x02_070580 [Trema orientale]